VKTGLEINLSEGTKGLQSGQGEACGGKCTDLTFHSCISVRLQHRRLEQPSSSMQKSCTLPQAFGKRVGLPRMRLPSKECLEAGLPLGRDPSARVKGEEEAGQLGARWRPPGCARAERGED